MVAEKKQQKHAKEPTKKEKGEATKEGRPSKRPIIAAAIIIIIVAVVAFLEFPNISSVPFSTFKSGFQSAQNVSVTVTYNNISQYSAESPCASLIIEAIAHNRKASTMDLFIIDASNQTCTYQRSLGQAAPQTANASYCSGIAHSEPTVFLNYSDSNYTLITPSSMYIYGNSAYMSACPIEIELS